jgi:iron complex outermembrane receptor protein
MSFSHRWPLAASRALIPAIVAVGSVAAQAQQAQVTLSIPSMPLSKALLAYAQQTRLSIVAPDELTEGRMSVAVTGTLTQSDGLRQLLGESGLKFQFVDSASVRIYGDKPVSQRGPDSGDGLETVEVTAQYRKEDQQSVPISITTVSGKTLENSGYQSITDLQYLVPGVQYDPTQGANFLIRGVGLQSYDFSFEKSVSVVVDDVVMDAQRDNGLIGLEDISHVDVLMGPQGTLFGKNATSGVISVSTNNPVLNQWQAKAYASYGERNDHTVNATLNAPIGDSMALRLSAFNQGQDGFGEYTTLNEKLGTVREYGVRGKFLFEPNDKFDVTVAGDWEHHWDSSIRTAVSGASATVTADEIALGVTPGPHNVNTADSEAGSIRYDEWGTSIRAHYTVGDDTLTSISAYRGTTFVNAAPVDLLPTNLFAYSTYSVGFLNSEKLSQELRWASPTGQFLEYVAGFFYNDLTANQYQYQWGPGTPGTPLVGTQLYAFSGVSGVKDNAQYFSTSNITAAEFGQLKITLTDQFNLTLGARYSNDRNEQSLGFVNFPTAPITGTNSNYTFVTINKAPQFYQGSSAGHDFTYRIAPQYKFSDDAMIYATYATGNKPAGIALNGNNFDPYKPETVSSWEAGEKSEWLDHRVRVNFDLFLEQYKDYQAPLLTQIPAGAGGNILATVIGNAGGLRSEGAEASVAVKPISPLTLTASASYTHAYFTNYVYNSTTNYTNTTPPNAPAWAATFGADYHTEVLPDLSMLAHIDYDWRDKIWTIVGQPRYSLVKAYGLINARISFMPNDSNFEFGIYGRNLGNTFFQTGFQQYGTAGLLHFTTPDAYRTVGVFGKYEF